MVRTSVRALALAAVVLITWSADPSAQSSSVRTAPVVSKPALAATRPITHDAYDGWKSIQGVTLSRDGAWLAYALTPQDGDGELVVRHLATGKDAADDRGPAPGLIGTLLNGMTLKAAEPCPRPLTTMPRYWAA